MINIQDNMAEMSVGNISIRSAYIGSQLVWEKSSPALPYDAEIAYLESEGGAYINTGIIPSSDIRLTIDGLYPANAGSNLVCGAIEQNNGTYQRFHIGITNGYFQGGVGTQYGNIGTFSVAKKQFIISGRDSTASVEANGSTSSFTGNSTYPTIPIFLFARNFDGTASNFHEFRLYSADIYSYSNDYKIMDLIPVRVGQTGYLYDKVSGQLFGNAGTGSFILGPDVGATLPYDSEVYSLKSTGTQYINLNITPTSETGIYIKVNCSNNNDVYFCGLRNTSGNTRWGAGHSSNGFYWCYNTYQTSNKLTGTWGEIKLNYKNDNKFVAAYSSTVKEQALPTLSFTPSYPIWLFGYSGSGSTKWSGQIYFVRVTQGNDIILDLRPVRVGQVGYLYDRISGTLYGNNGTGSFTVGSDVT